MHSVIQISELSKRRAGPKASFELRVPRLRLRAGEVVAIRGVSGSGKSTLLDLLAMALQPDKVHRFQFSPKPGTVIDVAGLWRRGGLDALGLLRGRHMGYVLQTGGLLSYLTVRDNILLPCRLVDRRADRGVDDMVKRLGIADHLDKRPGQLSVGERQRVAIARALAHRPRVVLADEPTASLDPLHADTVLELFLDLVGRLGVTAVITTHEWSRVEALGLPVLEHRIASEGTETRALFWSRADGE